jgi:hypothetical protein
VGGKQIKFDHPVRIATAIRSICSGAAGAVVT